MCNTLSDKCKLTSYILINSFQLFNILKNNVGKLIIPMPIAEEVMRTQTYDKVDECKTLQFTDKSYIQY